MTGQMTAQRWWVRLAARWLARVDGVSGQIRLAMLGLTGVSTASLTLQQYGYGEYALPFIITLSLGTLVYTYLYTEGGVWNQTARDRADLSTNYSGPTMLYDALIRARQYSILLAQIEDRPRDEIYRELVHDTLDEWAEYRDGLEMEQLDTELENGNMATLLQKIDQ